MKLIINAPDLNPTMKRQLENDLKGVLPGIKRRLGHTATEEKIFRVAVTVHGDKTHKPTYSLTMSLHLPDQPVVVQKTNGDLKALVDACEKAIKKELRRVLARLRKEHLQRRRSGVRDAFVSFAAEANLTPLPIKAAETAPPPNENPIFARLRPLLGPLYSYSRDQIGAAESAGELRAGYLSPDDLVDQAIIRVADQPEQVRDASKLEAMLYRCIDETLAEEIAREHPGGGEPMESLESGAPVDQRWGIEGVEVEEREYFQPFATLRMEDILADEHAIDPEHQLTDDEQHRLMLKYLGSFPSKARSAFYLSRIEGFDLFEIAMIQNRSELDVEKDVSRCMEALKDGWKTLSDGAQRTEATA